MSSSDVDADPGQVFGGDADPDQVLGGDADLDQVLGGDADPDQVFGGDADPDQVLGGDADPDQVFSGDADPDQVSGGDADPDQVSGGDADPDQVLGGDADPDQVSGGLGGDADPDQVSGGDANPDQVVGGDEATSPTATVMNDDYYNGRLLAQLNGDVVPSLPPSTSRRRSRSPDMAIAGTAGFSMQGPPQDPLSSGVYSLDPRPIGHDTSGANFRQWLNFHQVKNKLAVLIEQKTGKTKVEVDDSFFTTAEYRVLRKNRDHSEKKWLLSEQITQHENLTQNIATYNFQVSFNETNTTTLTLTKGRSFTLGANAGGGFGGANIGLAGGITHSRSRGASEGQSHADTRQMTVTFKVPPNMIGRVRELVYHKQYLAECHFYLLLGMKKDAGIIGTIKSKFKKKKIEDEVREKDKGGGIITFSWERKEKDNIKVTDLFKDLNPSKHDFLTELDNIICINMKDECTFSRTEHALETLLEKSNPQRLEMIGNPFLHRLDEDDLSLEQIDESQHSDSG